MSEQANGTQFSPENDLTHLLKVTRYLRQVLGDDPSFSLSDTEKYIYHSPSERLKLGLKAGDAIKPGSIAETCIKTGERVVKNIPREVMGTPFIGIGIPIKDDDRVIGTIAIGIPVDTQEKVSRMAVDLNSSLAGIIDSSNNLMSASEQLAAAAQELARNTSEISGEIREMDQVIELIKEVSDQTHLLGLNASIEAARAGDQGKGFNVVAEEIRKLAAKTNSSVKDISGKLKKIQETVLDLSARIQQVSSVSQHQASSAGEIASRIDQLGTMSGELAKLADELVR
ncbi:MAG: chemotaxis protein [Peptococcaceae bacterium]|nr:chemotaxis protein [Peptococcaceae bacterium]